MANTFHKLKASVGLGQQGEEESGRSVHQQYRSRIRAFQKLVNSGKVAETDPEGWSFGGDDDLGELFDLSRQLAVDRATLAEKFTEERERTDQQSREIAGLHGQIEQLQETVVRRESRLESIYNKRKQMQVDHAAMIDQITLEHADQMRAAERRLEMEKQRHEAEKQKLESEKRHIQAQLLVSHEKSYAWPDEKLRVQFLELCRLLNNATATIAASVDFPAADLGSGLDPDDTFRITGPTGVHFWLRSRAWAVIEAGFFSRPYGFGAFGPEKGARELGDVFGAWASRLDGSSDPDDFDGVVGIFRTNETANRWRSVTFQSLSTAGSLAAEGHANVERVAGQLHALLSAIVSACGAELENLKYSTLHNELRSAASVAFELALQCGVNPAALSLLSTPRGSSVIIDRARGFEDCEDGQRRGQSVVAALVVQPGWVREGGEGGNGRRTVVVPCEVFTGT